LLLLCCAVLFCTANAAAQDSVERSFLLKQIGPDVWAAVPNPKAEVPTVTNAGFVIGDDAVAVIDTLFTFDANGNPGNESNTQLLEEIRKLTKLPIKYVINTHHHPDHTGGNGIFAAAGAVIVAQHNVRGWIHSENLRVLGQYIKPEQRAFIEAIVG